MSLAARTAFFLIVFCCVTHRLVPPFSVCTFLAFTLSQACMLVRWSKKRGPHWWKSAFVNGLGAFVTGITVCVVLVAKFVEGAWITLIFIPMLVMFFGFVRRHYHDVRVRTACKQPVVPADHSAPPIAVVPVDRWSRLTEQAIEF